MMITLKNRLLIILLVLGSSSFAQNENKEKIQAIDSITKRISSGLYKEAQMDDNNNLAKLYAKTGKLNEAVKQIDFAITLAKECKDYNRIAQFLGRKKDYFDGFFKDQDVRDKKSVLIFEEIFSIFDSITDGIVRSRVWSFKANYVDIINHH
ncbi:MAG: hypothetical protein HRT57_09940 [Crocinitomicaceae bacterium]|nr:hypothetical protein [Crocinitomicaceae bacterium]